MSVIGECLSQSSSQTFVPLNCHPAHPDVVPQRLGRPLHNHVLQFADAVLPLPGRVPSGIGKLGHCRSEVNGNGKLILTTPETVYRVTVYRVGLLENPVIG